MWFLMHIYFPLCDLYCIFGFWFTANIVESIQENKSIKGKNIILPVLFLPTTICHLLFMLIVYVVYWIYKEFMWFWNYEFIKKRG